MKKLVILALGLFTALHITAQEENKQKKNYLPQQGDWAVGIDVTPIFKYIGNAFNGNTDNELESLGGTPFTKNYRKFYLTPDVSIAGKYMLTDEWALRANIGFMIRSEYNRRYVQDDRAVALDPFSEDKVIDKVHTTANGVSLSLGSEYRRGNRRVQGVFGMGVLFAYQKHTRSFDWGNEMTSINQQPSVAFNEGQYYYMGYRMLKDYSNGSDFYTGITGSVGIEWFVGPKISLGAEVNLVAYYLWGSQTYKETEGYNTSTQKVERKTDLLSPGDRGFYCGTESLGGSLNMTFYF